MSKEKIITSVEVENNYYVWMVLIKIFKTSPAHYVSPTWHNGKSFWYGNYTTDK